MCDYSKLKILYVEDEKSIVAFVKILFKKNNISNVVYAYDGAEALEYYKKENFDIVMTDIMMPKMDGYELITNIRKINSKQIFTIITGQEKTEDLIKAIKTRANFFIQKPILPKEFQDVLKDSIDLACQKNSLDYSNMVLSQYKDAMDSTTILSKTDKEGFITYVNDKFIEISGFREDELIGQNHNIVRDQDLPKEIFEDLWKTIKNKQKWHGIVSNKRKDGTKYIVDVTVVPILDNEGEIKEYIGIRHDVTELKRIKDEIEAIHKHTRDSIEYASLIQHSLIPKNDIFKKYFSNYLAIWHPKDIVGGDIYLFEELRNDDECMLMVIDCTGHGVPSAFVTMIVKSIERQIVATIINRDEVVSPAKILSIFNKSMKHLLKQEEDDAIANAGFDGGILYYNKKDKQIKYAGANTPLFYLDENNEYQTIKGSRHSVGYKSSDPNYEFKEDIIDVKEGMQFYLTTDGYLDQNGGVKGFPFGKKRFKAIVEEYHEESFADQQEVFLEELHEYQGDEDRNDDITLIALKI